MIVGELGEKEKEDVWNVYDRLTEWCLKMCEARSLNGRQDVVTIDGSNSLGTVDHNQHLLSFRSVPPFTLTSCVSNWPQPIWLCPLINHVHHIDDVLALNIKFS